MGFGMAEGVGILLLAQFAVENFVGLTRNLAIDRSRV